MQHERHHVAGQHVRFARVGQQAAGEVAEMIDRIGDVDGARLADRLAVVEGLEQREVLGVLLDDVGDLVQDDGALRLGGLAPALEGSPCGVDGAVDVLLRSVRDGGELFAVGRAEHIKGLPIGGRGPFAADIESVGFLSRVLHVSSFLPRGTAAALSERFAQN